MFTLRTDSGKILEFSSLEELTRYTSELNKNRKPTVDEKALRSLVKNLTKDLNLNQEQEEEIFNDLKSQTEEHIKRHWPPQRD